MKKKIVFVDGELGSLFKKCKYCYYWETEDGEHGKCWCYGGPFEDIHTDPNESCFEFSKK